MTLPGPVPEIDGIFHDGGILSALRNQFGKHDVFKK
jgi:6-phosphogluconate dehydrogenase (decarboxylating)